MFCEGLAAGFFYALQVACRSGVLDREVGPFVQVLYYAGVLEGLERDYGRAVEAGFFEGGWA